MGRRWSGGTGDTLRSADWWQTVVPDRSDQPCRRRGETQVVVRSRADVNTMSRRVAPMRVTSAIGAADIRNTIWDSMPRTGKQRMIVSSSGENMPLRHCRSFARFQSQRPDRRYKARGRLLREASAASCGRFCQANGSQIR